MASVDSTSVWVRSRSTESLIKMVKSVVPSQVLCKDIKVLVLCTPDKVQKQPNAGADYAGLDDYIGKNLKADGLTLMFIITMPNVMAKVGRTG